MTAPTYLTFDGDPANNIVPRRPSVDDLGGAAYEDDQEYPPHPPEEPMAADVNQIAMVEAAIGRTASAVCLSVNFAAGVPSIVGQAALGSTLTTSSFAVTGGAWTGATGTVTISWAATALPPSNLWPRGLTLHALGYGYAVPVTAGVQVHLATTAHVASDIAFSLDIHGTAQAL